MSPAEQARTGAADANSEPGPQIFRGPGGISSRQSVMASEGKLSLPHKASDRLDGL
jgi:hypothetical protein